LSCRVVSAIVETLIKANSSGAGTPPTSQASCRTTNDLFKVSFPAGCFFALPFNWRRSVNGHAYGSLRELVEHAVAIEKRLIAEAIAAGCRYVQLDFPTYPLLCDRDWAERIKRAGFDWQETLDLCEWADREVVEGIPEHVHTAIHMCRGNNQNYYVAEGAFDPVAERLALSTQCGFASTLKGNAITEERQWEKLCLVADVARAYWR
jgi:methionine synthase II (cobalamin-independent)